METLTWAESPVSAVPSGDTVGSQGPSVGDFTNTFVISSDADRTLCEIPNNLAVDPFRQRRAHHKSKRGCIQCRKRRVKCDEKLPQCSACSRRQEPCRRAGESVHHFLVSRLYEDVNALASDLIPTGRPATRFSQASPANDSVNLFHMKLFHHFQTQTIPTLCMGMEIWDQALQLSFNFEALMQSILCLSARHLSILHPEEPKYAAAASTHLIRTLSLHRDDLTRDISVTNVDALMTTAILLHYELWNNVDFVSLETDGNMSLDLTKDFLFRLSSGTKHVFMNSIRSVFDKPSVYVPYIRFSPRAVLVKAARISRKTLEKFQEHFAYDRPLEISMMSVPLPYIRGNKEGTDLAGDECWILRAAEMEASDRMTPECFSLLIIRLCLILSFLPEAQDTPSQPLLDPEIAAALSRYIFSFPVVCHKPIVSMIRDGDLHVLLLLYHFYRAVRILLVSDRDWWAQRRASILEMVLHEHLLQELARAG